LIHHLATKLERGAPLAPFEQVKGQELSLTARSSELLVPPLQASKKRERKERKRIMATPSNQGEDMQEAALPEADEDEGDEGQFHLLARESRHFSLYPSPRKLRRKIAISMSNGYGGVHDYDYDHRVIDADLTVTQLFRQEFLTKPAVIFQVEVKNAQKGLGGDFFLEMGLTKNMSSLPDKRSIQDVADGLQKMTQALGMSQRKSTSSSSDDDEMLLSTPDTSYYVTDEDDDETTLLTDFSDGKKKKLTKKRRIPISAYLQLLLAVAALSSIGPFLDRLDGVSPPLRIVWRQQGTVLVLWPFALRSILVDGPPRLSLAQWCTILCASFSYSVLTVAFSASLNYTTVNDATILTNSQSLLLVVAKLVIGGDVVFLEWSGKRYLFCFALARPPCLLPGTHQTHVALFPLFCRYDMHAGVLVAFAGAFM
jgi:hypothetical protein